MRSGAKISRGKHSTNGVNVSSAQLLCPWRMSRNGRVQGNRVGRLNAKIQTRQDLQLKLITPVFGIRVEDVDGSLLICIELETN